MCVDELLARHIAHLFIRDPVSLFSEKINQDDENDTDHFENIQSTNWQTMRFKPPPPNSNIGWRVEFRPMEAQFTDFENAAFTVFIVLLTRVILSYKLNFIIPISKVDENMKTAFKRDAVLNDKFYFRKDVVTEATPLECAQQCGTAACNKVLSNQYELMTINEIFQGKDEFPGLIPLINLYLQSIEVDVDTRCTITQYLKLISLRASGALETSARWIRNFVMTHELYKGDSVVPEGTVYDLLKRVAEISSGKTSDPRHLFSHVNRSSGKIPEALSSAEAFLEEKLKSTNSGGSVNSDTSLSNGSAKEGHNSEIGLPVLALPTHWLLILHQDLISTPQRKTESRTSYTMSAQLASCLGLLVVLAMNVSGGLGNDWFCKNLHESCTPMAGDCCNGMTCQRGTMGRWKCMVGGFGGVFERSIGGLRGDIGGGVCQRRGQLCVPGLNNKCCPGLYCRSKPLRPNLHECW
ncbi:hypothetical protein RRG08_010702 [Elysia crispata]|uniref:Glutamate--cysteine ligase n=1 Tax=Elysia crispata TaxID=231223 RepID=A0AAE1D6D8_9GAST|nr:hypothetical protein RRG08_010702 [Elysia crispata]